MQDERILRKGAEHLGLELGGSFHESSLEIQAFADACGVKPDMVRVNQDSGELELNLPPEPNLPSA